MINLKKLVVASILLLTSTVCLSWPNKEITIIVPYQAGGMNDILARTIQPELEKKFNVPVVVKNMPGEANGVAINYILSNPNDNHTFLLTMDDFISGPLFRNSDSYKKFKAITIIGTAPFLVFGGPNTSIQEFKQEIKNRSVVNIANAGINGGADLWLTQFSPTLNLTTVPFVGTPPIFTNVQGGQIKYGVLSMGSSFNLIKAGKLVPIMISSDKRDAIYPSVPTFKELGLPGNAAHTWFGIVTRSDTDTEATQTMSSAINAIVSTNQIILDYESKGLHIVNYNLSTSNKFFNNEVTRFENFKAKQK